MPEARIQRRSPEIWTLFAELHLEGLIRSSNTSRALADVTKRDDETLRGIRPSDALQVRRRGGDAAAGSGSRRQRGGMAASGSRAWRARPRTGMISVIIPVFNGARVYRAKPSKACWPRHCRRTKWWWWTTAHRTRPPDVVAAISIARRCIGGSRTRAPALLAI